MCVLTNSTNVQVYYCRCSTFLELKPALAMHHTFTPLAGGDGDDQFLALHDMVAVLMYSRNFNVRWLEMLCCVYV